MSSRRRDQNYTLWTKQHSSFTYKKEWKGGNRFNRTRLNLLNINLCQNRGLFSNCRVFCLWIRRYYVCGQCLGTCILFWIYVELFLSATVCLLFVLTSISTVTDILKPLYITFVAKITFQSMCTFSQTFSFPFVFLHIKYKIMLLK